MPAVMVSHSTGQSLRRAAFKQFGRVKFHRNIIVKDAWAELLRLQDFREWPRGDSERKAKFKVMSKRHHPDKAGGSTDRFFYLRHVYSTIIASESTQLDYL